MSTDGPEHVRCAHITPLVYERATWERPMHALGACESWAGRLQACVRSCSGRENNSSSGTG
eukprot:1157624-Pelagomonas_calceolata.AAC.4